MKTLSALFVLGFLFMANVYSQSETGILPPAWQTTAEKTNYAKTSTYDEAVAYSKKLAAASGGLIVYKSYGKSGEGRDMPLLIAASGKAFTPEIASKQGKAVVLIQAGIHAGEIDGKDAGLALLRDIAITKTRLDLLKDVVILFEVIYNVDGHENSNPFMRMNQNGPDEMGFRANASNLNLNRDYMKADAPETRAWLGLWNRWRPDAFVDCHVTDGADFQYNLTYEYAHFQEVNPAVKNWMDEHFDGVVVPNVASEGNLLTHYIEFAGREVTSGIATFIATPRFATGYTPLRNRAGLLIETHVYKPYKSRVRGTYDTLRYFIEEIGKSKASLFAVNKTADDESSALGRTYDRNAKFPIVLGVTDKATEIAFKGLDYRIDDSPISGAKRLVYGTIPTDYTIKKFDDGKVVTAVAPPLAYIVPPQYKDVIDVLKLHGIKFTILKKAQTMDVESYKLTEPKWSTNSFENRITLSCKPLPIAETRTYAAGSVVVRLDQDTANVAIHLLEPAGPDSFVYWGFFNSIFEQKEYGESYQIEKVAVEMLAKDPKLKAEFETKLKDEGFAKNPRARLNFFYERSPYYLNQKIGVYPVGRIISHNHLQ
ncbi:MAG: peptidase M14 [Chloracidobacterium sp.]|nr:peptidase M14 [Chloracidobacterium sp.]MBL0240708.1 peptidase M14 [Chloracidobacterium sp.]